MLTVEQLRMRRTGISATDAVALSGASPWSTAHDVYASKVDESEPSTGSFATSLGHELEPIVLRHLAEERGLSLTPGETERHPTLTWALATPDANVIVLPSEPRRVAVAEVKVVGARLFSRWSDEEVPDYVAVQCAWQMFVTRTETAYVGALLGTELKTYVLSRDAALESALVELCGRFWERHVLARRPPEPDGSEAAKRMLQAAWPRTIANVVSSTADAEDAARAYLEAKAQREEAAKREEEAKQKLMVSIGEAEGIAGPGWQATWKWQPGGRVEAHERKPARVFRFSQKKEKAA